MAENRTDITVPGFIITEERHKLVDFSVPFFSQGLYIWIKKPEVRKLQTRVLGFDNFNVFKGFTFLLVYFSVSNII